VRPHSGSLDFADTEEVTGSNPVAPTIKALTSGNGAGPFPSCGRRGEESTLPFGKSSFELSCFLPAMEPCQRVCCQPPRPSSVPHAAQRFESALLEVVAPCYHSLGLPVVDWDQGKDGACSRVPSRPQLGSMPWRGVGSHSSGHERLFALHPSTTRHGRRRARTDEPHLPSSHREDDLPRALGVPPRCMTRCPLRRPG
jgi:hypothetical protein